MSNQARRVRVAIMDDYPVIVSGVHQLLAPYADRIEVVEMVSLLPVSAEVDVLLYDTYSHERIAGQVVDVLEETDARVVLYTWTLAREVVAEALAQGAAACVSKSLPAEELVSVLERVHQGEIVISPDPGPEAPIATDAWPGKEHGLSPRESEILALICQGLSNQEVADRAYLSINSVKTFIRSAYRKIKVQRRTQAVLWATEHGFLPESRRFLTGRAPQEDES